VHWKSSSRPFGRRGKVAVAFGIAAAVLLATPGLAAAKPHPPTPPTPPKQKVSQSQVDKARDAKRALANQIGELNGQIAQAQIQVQQAEGKAEQAEQKYADAIKKLQDAQQAAKDAQAALTNAKVDVTAAHARFVQFIQASYMSGDVGGTAGSLLTAPDPSSLLEQSSLEQYQEQHNADAVGALQAATVLKSNAEAKAKLAVAASKHAKAVAAQRKKDAQAAFVAAQQLKTQLDSEMAAKQREMQDKRMQLLSLEVGRARTIRYQHAYADYQQRLSSYHVALARWNAAQRRKHQRAAQGGGSSYHPGPSAPSGGSWTAAKGHRAAQRALSQLGMPYAWAGGGAYGPSRGVCAGGDAWNDCNVIGYDCSGLAMYAWGASWWAHYAATQYTQAGRYHPGAGNLRQGDLIFWSFNGRISGIHHVAIYIGGGRIVEAPYSGGYVQTASLYEYGGFFGATRPLT
jgi:cell wall-associated NlpC family hydrolase